MEWQEIGKGESVVSLLVNEHDEVKLHSYGLETSCINCCILFPGHTNTHTRATGIAKMFLGVIPRPTRGGREVWKGGGKEWAGIGGEGEGRRK